MTWTPDPNDPLQESPKAVLGRVLTLGPLIIGFWVILVVAMIFGG